MMHYGGICMILRPTHPLLVLSTEFTELCKPLEMFHIHHFTYQKQFNDGTRISLSNKTQWVDDYYNLKLYESSLFEEKPSSYKPAFNVWTEEYDIPVYAHGRTYYDTGPCISITEPHHDGCEHYLFSTAPDKPEVIHYLANNMDILYHFVLYLKDRGVNIFKKAQDNRVVVQKSFIGPTESRITNKDFYQAMQRHKRQFFDKTPIRRFTFETGDTQGIRLTQREINCIMYLLQNKTAHETAESMNLSRRTVESYLDNIKIKLDCDNKIDLLKKLKENKFLFSLREKHPAAY
jgi:DNA-binding CsgD family transcriptional regulator